MDPYSPQASDLTYALARPIYPSLFRFLPDGSTEPSLAQSWDEVPGGAEVTLRDARWSNGRRITALDVIKSVRRARLPSGFARVTGVRSPDARTILFKGGPGNWERTLATAAFVLPRGRFDPDVSGGPFEIASRTRGLQIVYRPNSDFWGASPYLRRLRVQYVEDIDVLLALLDAGRLDAAAPPSTVNLDDRLGHMEIAYASRLGWESVALAFNSSMSRSDRIAIAGRVNRRGLEQGFVRDEGRVANTHHPVPGVTGAAGPWSRRRLKRRADRSGEMPSGTLSIAVPNGDELLVLVQHALQIALDSTGTDVATLMTDATTFYGPWRRSSPAEMAIRRISGAPGLSDPRGAFEQMEALPLFHVETFVAFNEGVIGIEPNPTLEGPLWNAAEWWKEPKGRRM